ncbi:23S rRNA (uracil1939-C5)-methyltransferase [Paenibacillus phyllosphaerae]|uniref:23S rRNA (Uracil1939-C5)-methyltransferase n=1 Tax=Paenibacillus phyllosphaerae TaxID=274593 RepID=A0A7W5B079_9BACL|nr:23S rRNA (uracil(1939)-C(5))-methyltransferase RlmD [Paenibacillus phyllosphaerae]MBB3111953.1 23S rRNA (uracil1939-C5)-methyltransferase [Paenibacillus phyllosphaerae]
MTVPVTKNDVVTVDIVGLTHEGEGVGRADGFTLFIQGALPGERVRAKVLKVKKQYGYAKMQELMTASPDRTDAPCPIFKQCGGCQLQHMSYAAQLRWKRQHVVDNLVRIGKLDVAGEGAGGAAEVDAGEAKERLGGVVVHPTIGMDEPWRYRNKASVPMGMGPVAAETIGAAGASQLIGGFYASNSHRIIDMDQCMIQHEHNDDVVRVVKQIGRELGITVYNEETNRGLLRHVMTRVGFVTGEVMVVLITNGYRIPQLDTWIARIREALPQVKSIVQNINMRTTNVIFGDETKTLWGSDVIYDELDGIRFAISARSFYQVNPSQTIALYGKTVEYAQLTGTENVIDAYCGIGTISLFLARRAGHVYGVEIVPEAIEDAKRNAQLNEIGNADFEAGAAEVVIPRWCKEGIVPDVIVVDPPRKGCDPALLETILAMKPQRVVYVSCNPSTLARDLRVLEDGGFKTVEVQPVDMFPHTSHVECVASLIYKGLE